MPKKKEPSAVSVAAPKAPAKPRKRASAAPEETTLAGNDPLPMNLLAEEALLQYEFTPDAIAVRAYFLGEKRRAEGLHPDPVRDWLEAEGEILAELSNTPAPRKEHPQGQIVLDNTTHLLTAALRERLAVIADRSWYQRDPEGHLKALQNVSENIQHLAAQLPPPVDPQLAHYFQRCSFDKALAFLETGASRTLAGAPVQIPNFQEKGIHSGAPFFENNPGWRFLLPAALPCSVNLHRNY